MARYCFYCGRELEDYERCDCRSRTFASQGSGEKDGPAAASGTWQEEKTAPPPPSYGWQHRAETAPPKRQKPKRRRTARRKPAPINRGQLLQSFFGFFMAPAHALDKDLDPEWKGSHSIWLAVSSLMGGLHFLTYSRKLTVWLGQEASSHALWESLLAWLAGSVLIALVFLIYTLALWLLSRYLFRQRGLPFPHALAAGKSAWKYASFFFILALPSLYSGAWAYGITLAVMGLVFAVLVQARQTARLTYLDENRGLQLSFLSILVFASLFSAFTSLSRLLTIFR